MSKTQVDIVDNILNLLEKLEMVNKLKILNMLEVERATWLEGEDQE